jgi:Glycosyl transferase family 2
MEVNRLYRWTSPHPALSDVSGALSPLGPNKCLLSAIVRNEAPYLVEWAAYHYALGFREIVVFSNFCDDLSDLILDRLDDLGIVRHRPHPGTMFPQVGQIQISALRLTTLLGQFKASDYMMMIDLDEYLEVCVGDHDLASFFAAVPEFEVASFAVRGRNAEEKRFIESGEVLTRFLQASWPNTDRTSDGDSVVCAVKSLARSRLTRGFHRNHRPMIAKFSTSGKRWINGAGTDMGPDFTDRRASSIRLSGPKQLALVNHYNIRSAESFMVKAQRGNASGAARLGMTDVAMANTLKYWTSRNTTPQVRHDPPHEPPGFRALLEFVRSDQIIADLQARALDIHRERAALGYGTELGRKLADMIGYAPHDPD